MKLFIHDLEERDFQKLFPNLYGENMIISDDGTIHHCIGCIPGLNNVPIGHGPKKNLEKAFKWLSNNILKCT